MDAWAWSEEVLKDIATVIAMRSFMEIAIGKSHQIRNSHDVGEPGWRTYQTTGCITLLQYRCSGSALRPVGHLRNLVNDLVIFTARELVNSESRKWTQQNAWETVYTMHRQHGTHAVQVPLPSVFDISVPVQSKQTVVPVFG